MPRKTLPLYDTNIRSAKPGDTLRDGGGLILEATESRKSWRLKYKKPDGKESRMHLGDWPAVSLAAARRERDRIRELLRQGIDPAQHKRDEAIRAEAATRNTFEAVARDWHEVMCSKWGSEQHRANVLKRLEQHLFPFIGKRPIDQLVTMDILNALKKTEDLDLLDTASRLKQYTKQICRRAVQHGLIAVNPALDLDGAIKTRKTTHHPALPLARIPELLERIDAYKGRIVTKLAVKLTLLTFLRSSEVRLARWSEIDFKRKQWHVPGTRAPIEGVKFSDRGMKMKRDHLVPLSRQAMEIIEELHAYTGRFDLMFVGDHDPVKPMSENTVNAALRTMGYDTKTEVCGHGFRAMARSSLAESKAFSKEAIERQMSHLEGNDVVAAYNHLAEYLHERQAMLAWWADYLDAIRSEYLAPYEFQHGGSNVTPLFRSA